MFMSGEYIGASVEAKVTSQNAEVIKSSHLSSTLSDYSVVTFVSFPLNVTK